VPLAVEGRDVVLGYDGHVAVDRSDFSIPRGRLTAVIGPNGSGKSTLLGAIAGILEPRSGEIRVLGSPPGRVHRRVAYVLQATKVNEVMPITVRETVMMGRYALAGFFGPMRRDDREACRDALDRLGIAELGGRHLTELSGGQRQRVFVAQGLAQEADVLLLDEPVTGLDLVSRERIRAAIEEELAAGTTVIATTHDVAEAADAGHVLLMSGRVHTEGPPDRALHPDRLSDAYGIGIVHLEDGSVVLDDPLHRPAAQRHVHFERRERRRAAESADQRRRPRHHHR
jgi:manganese transport system ATP-binding protein